MPVLSAVLDSKVCIVLIECGYIGFGVQKYIRKYFYTTITSVTIYLYYS